MIVDKHQYATLSHGILWMLHISNLFHNLISILCQNAVRQNNEPKKKRWKLMVKLCALHSGMQYSALCVSWQM